MSGDRILIWTFGVACGMGLLLIIETCAGTAPDDYRHEAAVADSLCVYVLRDTSASDTLAMMRRFQCGESR